jgi:hypothetical protein
LQQDEDHELDEPEVPDELIVRTGPELERFEYLVAQCVAEHLGLLTRDQIDILNAEDSYWRGDILDINSVSGDNRSIKAMCSLR